MKKISLLFLILISFTTYSQTLTDSLIGYWPFNGCAIDESNNHNDGVVFGPVLTTDRFGIENSAYYFDGTDDFIEIIPSSDVSVIGDFTLALWMYCDKYTIQSPLGGMLDRQFIFESGSNSNTVTTDFYREGIRVMIDYTENYDEQLHNSIIYDKVDVINNLLATNISLDIVDNWHFVVFTREYDEDRTYFDGQLLELTYSSYTKRSDSLDMQHPWYIGAGFGNNPYYNNWNYAFEGKIDDIRLYKRALDSAEVESLFNENVCYKTIIDTIHYFDTVQVFDTIHYVDTVQVFDTIFIYDTVTVYDTLQIDLNQNSVYNTNAIKIYPNPARSLIYISIDENFINVDGCRLRIINNLNQTVFEESAVNKEIYLDVGNFKTLGLYYVQLIDPNNRVLKTSKLVIQ